MPTSDRKTQVTAPDGEAARVQASAREDAATFELPVPRRKRYSRMLRLDLDARPPAEADPDAPRGPLEI